MAQLPYHDPSGRWMARMNLAPRLMDFLISWARCEGKRAWNLRMAVMHAEESST